MTTETDTLPLIRTKLRRPRLPGVLIPRRRLLDRLHAGSERKLTLISAMAGTGNTSLPTKRFEQSPQPITWHSLHKDDNDRPLFWSYPVDAVRAVFPETDLISELTDQASLVGIINHLNGLGLQEVSVECVQTPLENEPSLQDDISQEDV